MGDLVHLPGAEPKDERKLILVCPCGCTNFHLHADGHVECTNCENLTPNPDNAWHERVPAPPAVGEAVPSNEHDFKIIDLDTAPIYVRRKADLINGAAAIVIIGRNSDLSTWVWSGVETPEQREWLERRMAEAATLVRVKTCR